MPKEERGDCVKMWHGCYDGNWKGLIVDEAFAHPAKFARGLIRRIYQHALASGYLRPGDVVVDPFGGVALGALDAMQAGVRWFGCELEQRFVDLGQQNLAKWASCGLTGGVLVQGDSRRLCEVLGPELADCVLGSPPFSETRQPASVLQPGGRQGCHTAYREAGANEVDNYGSTEGQLGAMRAGDVAAVIEQAECVISSPPFSERHSYNDPAKEAELVRRLKADPNCKIGGNVVHQVPGTTPGQLAIMPTGSVDAVVSSPPYSGNEKHDYRTDDARYRGKPQGVGCFNGSETYGDTPGNIGNLPAGDVAAIVGSPPYADGARHTGGKCEKEYQQGGEIRYVEYGDAAGQLAALPPGDVADCILSSPPFENSAATGKLSEKLKADLRAATGRGDPSPSGESASYGTTPGNVGNDTGTTFWEAARIICQQCFQILRPGGICLWVTKDFVRKGQRVPFSADWQRLCIACGFEPVEWIKASLVKEQRHPGLFGDDVVKTTERKGFFRRLAEKKGSPKIDEEDVIIVRKPSRQ